MSKNHASGSGEARIIIFGHCGAFWGKFSVLFFESTAAPAAATGCAAGAAVAVASQTACTVFQQWSQTAHAAKYTDFILATGWN